MSRPKRILSGNETFPAVESYYWQKDKSRRKKSGLCRRLFGFLPAGRNHRTERKRAMNIGNSYSSWMHHTPQTGYGSRSGKTGSTGSRTSFLRENYKNDTDVINDAATEKTEAEETGEEKKTADMTYREQILAHMEEMAKKVKDGTVEPAFQIGAQTFTTKEWEKLLADFDDAEEALQEQIKELIAEVEKQAAKEAVRREAEGKPDGMDDNCTDVEVTDPEELVELLTGEVTKSTFPTDDPEHKHWFITCYSQNGIWCKEAYYENGKWVNRDCFKLPYTEPGQYEKVMAFIQRFPQDANLRFASHENFWEDFLAGKIDEDDFVNFFETSTDKDGVPDYTYEKDGSTYIDREKAKYAQYMNGFGAHFYTAEEMDLLWRGIIHENRKGLQKISDYDGQMTIPKDANAGGEKEEDDDLETKIITKPDGSTVLEIKTSYGVMEVEITEARKFGLQYEAIRKYGEEMSRPLAERN